MSLVSWVGQSTPGITYVDAQYGALPPPALLLSLSAFEAATHCSHPVDRWAPPSPQANPLLSLCSSCSVALIICLSLLGRPVPFQSARSNVTVYLILCPAQRVIHFSLCVVAIIWFSSILVLLATPTSGLDIDTVVNELTPNKLYHLTERNFDTVFLQFPHFSSGLFIQTELTQICYRWNCIEGNN